MTTLQIEIPDDLAQAAEREGLLTPQALEAMLRDMLRNQAGKQLLELTEPATRIMPEMSEEEVQEFVQAEIDACRAEKRVRDARSA